MLGRFASSHRYIARGREADSKDCIEKGAALRDKVKPDSQDSPIEEGGF